ncbi:MAG: polysaccharide deacetylase family protein [Cytophagales bacterium]|nr:polysaccharide deacetylase family protein [Cytophagales bacterium]
MWDIVTDKKEIFLTFDDGPIPEMTPFVLDLLDRHSAKATFFWVGENVRRYPHIAREVVARGHSIGNHTYNHLKGWETANDRYLENIDLCDKAIEEVTGVRTKLFRPPHGRIKPSQLKAVLPDRRVVMWDVLTADYDASLSSAKCLKKSCRITDAGSLVVFHDSLKARKNLLKVLPAYMKFFKNKGFCFSALPCWCN